VVCYFFTFFTFNIIQFLHQYNINNTFVNYFICSLKTIGGAYSRRVVRPSVRQSLCISRIRVRPITSLFEVRFYNYFTEMITILRRRVARNIWLLHWRSRSYHDLKAKLCQAHYFVIWRRILKIFHKNDYHIETTCLAQHLGCYLEGQGHNMIWQQNLVRPITLLFEVRCYNYFWQTTSLCPIPFRGALRGSTGSCIKTESKARSI